jgi:hypothetical protein
MQTPDCRTRASTTKYSAMRPRTEPELNLGRTRDRADEGDLRVMQFDRRLRAARAAGARDRDQGMVAVSIASTWPELKLETTAYAPSSTSGRWLSVPGQAGWTAIGFLASGGGRPRNVGAGGRGACRDRIPGTDGG